MAIFGKITGPIYCLGLVAPTIPGTPVPLSQNVTLNSSFGTPVTGIPPYTTTGVLSTAKCSKIILWIPKANTGLVYFCFKGGNKSTPNSIMFDFPGGAGIGFIIEEQTSVFNPSDFVIDADVANEGMRVTLVCTGP